MREIKFRGKVLFDGNHKFNGDWIYGYYRTNEHGNYFITETIDDIGNYIFKEIEVEEKTIGQFTGLKDKNGIEIYEGDIISNGQEKCLVIYDEEYAGFFLKLIDENFNKEKNWTNPMIDLSRKEESLTNTSKKRH